MHRCVQTGASREAKNDGSAYYIYVTVEHWCHNKYDYYIVIYIIRL